MDKEAERKAFDAVFGRFNVAVEESEEPDFLCTPSSGDEFGVEVTEFFLTQSDARLRNIRNYATDLIAGADYRHKDDQRNIVVKDIVLRRPSTGQETKMKAIPRSIPPHHQSIPKVLAAIAAKMAKYDRYAKRVTPIDLIVNDVDLLLRFESVRQLLRPIAFGDAFNSIVACPFREVYVVTVSKEKGDVCVPLRGNLFAGEIALFASVHHEHMQNTGTQSTVREYVCSLAAHLVKKFPTVEYFFSKNGMPRFAFGSISWGFTQDEKIEIVDESCANRDDWKFLDADINRDAIPDGLQEMLDETRANEFASYEFCFEAAIPERPHEP